MEPTQKLLELKSKSIKIAGSKINMQNSIGFLYLSNNQKLK